MIHQERLYRHIQELGMIGKTAEGGVTRFPYTDEDEQAKEYLIRIMEEAGLSVTVDAVGNIIGKVKGKTKQKLLCGSHVDTVRNGGNFDGCLGVLGAIEAVHCMREQHVIPGCAIEVIAFKNEEGNRFSSIMTGSRAICGDLQKADLEACDQDDIPLQKAAEKLGYPICEYASCAYDFHDVKGYLELHIEQGSILDDKQLPVGIVKGIAGLRRYTICIYGKSGHSGAIPMADRVDPVTAFGAISSFADRMIRKYPDAVATIGEIYTYPGSCNVICDHVSFSLDVRSLVMRDIESFIKELQEEFRAYEEKGFRIRMEETQNLEPALCDEHITEVIAQIMQLSQITPYYLMSGAGHDAMNFYGHCPIAMIFVRSEHGYSHRPDEYTSKTDCAIATDILFKTMINLSNS